MSFAELAVVRVVDGRLTQAWTNTGLPPGHGEQVLVVAAGVAVPASAAEVRRLVQCASGVRATWAPGVWVELPEHSCMPRT